MNDDQLAFIILAGIFALIVLILPVSGNVLGYTLTLPVVGWIAVAAVAILAIIVYMKK